MAGWTLRRFVLAGITAIVLGVAAGALTEKGRLAPPSAPGSPEAFDWGLPAWLPRPVVPSDNPMTAAKVELGRHLFYDMRLSRTGEMSCATCHRQERAFTDGRRTAAGATGEVHPRNAMSLANVAYSPVLTWANPLLDRLEAQALIPLFGEAPVEMGLAGREQQLFAVLRADPEYRRLFAAAFPEEQDPVSLGSITRALAAFERTLISARSPYDRYRYGGELDALSASAKRGEALFFSERLECFHCHGGINFSDTVRHERMAFPEVAFHNTGLYNIDGRGTYPPADTGLHAVTRRLEDMGRFRAPTLRNIAVTAPYMHDGSIATLEEVIDHYAAGGRILTDGPHAGIGRENPYKSSFLTGFTLTRQECADLLAFLHSLTDEAFLIDPRFGDPFAGRPPGQAGPPASRPSPPGM